LATDEVAWHAAEGIRTGAPGDFLSGRTAEILRLPEILQKHAGAAFPASIDPRHASIPEREFTAFLTAGQHAERAEAIPFILEAARAQVGKNFLSEAADAVQQEAAAVVFVLNSLRCVECCHGVIPHSGISCADLRAGSFLKP
jgi:hypothetical protein